VDTTARFWPLAAILLAEASRRPWRRAAMEAGKTITSASPRTVADEQPLFQQLRVLRARRWLVILVAAAITAAALAQSLIRSPTYTAKSSLNFKQVGATTGPNAQSSNAQLFNGAAAQSQAVTRNAVIRKVQQAVDSGISIGELRSSVQTSIDPTSNLVIIQATAGSAERAALIANQFARETQRFSTQKQRAYYARATRKLQRKAQALKQLGTDPSRQLAYRTGISNLLVLSASAQPVEIAHAARVPGSPSSPKPVRDTILGAILGLILGIIAAFVREAFDRRFNDADEIQQHLNLPLVGYVPDQALGEGLALNGAGEFSERDLDAFRVLRSNVSFLDVDRTLGSILVTSAMAEEGKTTVAAGIAYANSVAARRTLLVECDLRRPMLAQRLGIAPTPGLVDYLAGHAKAREIVQVATMAPDGSGSENTDRSARPVTETGSESDLPEAPATDLVCITAGTQSPRPTEILGSRRFGEFLDAVGKVYDLVVLDTAPLLPVGDTLELIPRVDGVLICVRLGQTTRDQALAAESAVERFPSGPIGVVVTGMRPGRGPGYYGEYEYGGAYRSVAKTE
jgi:polysaccharide biosynthesis transport protein